MLPEVFAQNRRGRGVHLHHRWGRAVGRPGRHHRRAAGRVRLQRRPHPGGRLGRAFDAGQVGARGPDLPAACGPPGRRRRSDLRAAVHRIRAGAGRWAGRLHRRDAVHGPRSRPCTRGPTRRTSAAGDLAQHDQRPGRRAGWQGRGRRTARLAVRAGRPPRRSPSRDDRQPAPRRLPTSCSALLTPRRVHLCAAAGRPLRPTRCGGSAGRLRPVQTTPPARPERSEAGREDILRIIGPVHTGASASAT